ncbi:MAG: prolyl oligopeptidase family serine peptidase [Bradymonadia bacterium]
MGIKAASADRKTVEPASDPQSRFTIDDFVALTRVGKTRVAPDGQWLVCEVSTLDQEKGKYTHDLWRVEINGGDPVPLTWGSSRDHSPSFRADGAVLFLSNRDLKEGKSGEDTRQQVWVLPAQGGEPRPLTHEPLGVSGFIVRGGHLVLLCPHLPGVPESEQHSTWRERQKHGSSALRYTEMTVRFWDHWLGASESRLVVCDGEGEQRQIIEGPWPADALREADYDLSRDGTRIAVTVNRRGADGVRDRTIALATLPECEWRIVGHSERVDHVGVCFSPDGRSIATVRHERHIDAVGKPTLWRYASDGSDSEGVPLGEACDLWPQLLCWSPEGDGVLVTADVEATVTAFKIPVHGAPERLISSEHGGSHTSIELLPGTDVLTLVGVRSTLIQPPEPFICVAGGSPRVLARMSGFDPSIGEEITVARHHASGAGGTPVEMLVVSPKVPKTGRGAMIWIHGGPIAHHADGWHWRWNALIGALHTGCTVVLPNPRGSTGYGQTFIEDIWHNAWGEACYTDVMAVADHTEALEGVDPQKIAVLGGSFGGYMANWIGGHTDRFCCLVSHAGIYRFSAFGGMTDEPGWFALQIGGAPDGARPEVSYSPHTAIEHWKTPTLITHGEKDYRVPIGESIMLFEALQRRGVPSELMIFPDEGHWINRPANIKMWYKVCLDYVCEHI